MPQATARLSQAEYPSYRIYEPDGNLSAKHFDFKFMKTC